MTALISQFFAFMGTRPVDLVALFANLGSVGALALNMKIVGWILGIIGSIALLMIYVQGGFVFDSTLMVYYIITGFFGAVYWYFRPKARGKEELAITDMPRKYWVPFAIGTALFTGLGGWLILAMGWTTLGLFVFVDAFTTALSLFAQWMLAKKWFQNWYVWIVADLIDIWLYFTKGLPVVGVLVIMYTVQCVFALFNWKRIRKQQEGDANVLAGEATVAPAV